MSDKAQCGIYLVEVMRPEKASKFYIGQSVDIGERWSQHLRALRRGDHDNAAMTRAFRKYGESAFSCRTILICRRCPEDLLLYEQKILDCYVKWYGRRLIYNVMVDCVASHLGVKRRQETIQRMSVSQKGRKKTPEEIARMSEARRGSRHSDKTKQKLSLLNLGRPIHPNTLKAAQDPVNKAKRADAIRLALCGKPRIHSEETKAKIKAARARQVITEESNEKRRLALIGRKADKEHVEKRVASRLLNKRIRSESEWGQGSFFLEEKSLSPG